MLLLFSLGWIETTDADTGLTDGERGLENISLFFEKRRTCSGTVARDVCRCASVKKSTRILTPFAARTSFTLGGQQSRRRGWKNVLRSVGNPVVFRRSSSLSPQQSVNKNHIHIFSVSIVGGGGGQRRGEIYYLLFTDSG